jgi:hypothetical protein
MVNADRLPRVTATSRAVRFVAMLSAGSMGAVRGCGGGSVCSCPVDDGGGVRFALGGSGECTPAQTDAGCRTEGVPSGPLPPPELA